MQKSSIRKLSILPGGPRLDSRMYVSRHTFLWSFELAGIFHFCYVVNTKLYFSIRPPRNTVMYCTASDELKDAKKRARFLFLSGAFAVRRRKMTADQIYSLLEKHF